MASKSPIELEFALSTSSGDHSVGPYRIDQRSL